MGAWLGVPVEKVGVGVGITVGALLATTAGESVG